MPNCRYLGKVGLGSCKLDCSWLPKGRADPILFQTPCAQDNLRMAEKVLTTVSLSSLFSPHEYTFLVSFGTIFCLSPGCHHQLCFQQLFPNALQIHGCRYWRGKNNTPSRKCNTSISGNTCAKPPPLTDWLFWVDALRTPYTCFSFIVSLGKGTR